MKRKSIIAIALCIAILTVSFSACSSKTPEERNADITSSSPDTLDITDKNEDVTGITASTDKNGKVIDAKGIIDISGHRIYLTEYSDSTKDKIYTTGKKDAKGNILYTKNKKDNFDNQIYYIITKTNKDGTVVLTQVSTVPDYTSNKGSSLTTPQRYSTTATQGYKANKITVSGLTKNFVSYYGGSGAETFSDVIADNKSDGYIAICTSTSTNGDFKSNSSEWKGNRSAIVKYKNDGSVKWSYFVGGSASVALSRVAQLKDGSVVAAGYTLAGDTDAPKNSKLNSALIVKVNKSGKLEWMYSFPGDEKTSNGEYISSIIPTSDGGFVVGGKADSTSGFFTGTDSKMLKAFIFKFDKNGSLKWRKILSGSLSNNITALAENSDGEIFALCVTHSTDGSFSDFTMFAGQSIMMENTVVLKLTKDGSLSWKKALYGSGHSDFETVCATTDGGCVVGGNYTIYKRADGSFSSAGNMGSRDGYVVRYTKKGTVYWARAVGGSQADYVTGVTAMDGGYIIVGHTKSEDGNFAEWKNSGENDGFVMLVNEAGETLYTETVSGKKDDVIRAVAYKNGSFAVAGFTSSSDNSFAKSQASGKQKAFIISYLIKKS